MRRGADQRHPRGPSSICYEPSSPCRPTALFARWYSGRNTAEEAWSSPKGSRSESPGQTPPEAGSLSAERVEERTMEQYAGVIGQ
jgi:hypothetical protein